MKEERRFLRCSIRSLVAKSKLPKEATTLFGFLNVCKEAGMTAHDVVAKVRRIVGIKQVGHSGTLDPMATGVLPIALGQATRLIRFLADDKVYDAEILFGRSTSTDDIEGEVIDSLESFPSDTQIQAAIPNFIGSIEQFPPLYSAVHVGGRRLYEMARNGEIPPEIPKRSVQVFSIDSLELRAEHPVPRTMRRNSQQISNPITAADIENCKRIRLKIHCGSGTYIRSIARDLGSLVGSPACLSALERTRVGGFALEDAVTFSQLEDAANNGVLSQLIKLPEQSLALEQIEVSDEQSQKLQFGQSVQTEGLQHEGSTKHSQAEPRYIMAICAQRLVAICTVQSKQIFEGISLAREDASIHTVQVLKPEVVIVNGRAT